MFWLDHFYNIPTVFSLDNTATFIFNPEPLTFNVMAMNFSEVYHNITVYHALISSYDHTSNSVCVFMHALAPAYLVSIPVSLCILMSQSSVNQRQFWVPIFLRSTTFEVIGHPP